MQAKPVAPEPLLPFSSPFPFFPSFTRLPASCSYFPKCWDTTESSLSLKYSSFH